MATFNPNRKTGGTIELVRDADGNYSTQEVGFNELKVYLYQILKQLLQLKLPYREAKRCNRDNW